MAATHAAQKPEVKEVKEVKAAEAAPQPAAANPFFINRMRDEFDRLFHRFTHNLPHLWDMGGNNWRWGVELEDKTDTLVVKAEAPGFEFDDFDIRVEDHRLVMKAAHKTESAKEKEGKTIEERQCYQSITLPCDVDKEKTGATYHNGVLTVTMPKVPDAKGRKIPVQGV